MAKKNLNYMEVNEFTPSLLLNSRKRNEHCKLSRKQWHETQQAQTVIRVLILTQGEKEK